MNRIQQIQSFIQKKPKDPFLYHALGMEFLREQKNTEAENAFRKAIDYKENYLGSYYQLAKLLYKLNRHQEASSLLNTGIKHAQNLGDMHTLSEMKTLKMNFTE